MKLLSVKANAHRMCFEVRTGRGILSFPFGLSCPSPSPRDPVLSAFIDRELAGEGFTFCLRSGAEGSVHADAILEFNRDPSHVRDTQLYLLTLEAQKRIAAGLVSKREVIRRLKTSATQLYRILDQTNYRKSIDQLVRLLAVLGCDVQFKVGYTREEIRRRARQVAGKFASGKTDVSKEHNRHLAKVCGG